jgi:uncharacterized protein (DUF1697 family)
VTLAAVDQETLGEAMTLAWRNAATAKAGRAGQARKATKPGGAGKAGGTATTSYVALLRAVNLGGRNAISMADLREMAEDLGLTDGKTLLQSGNLVFKSTRQSDAALERMLQAETDKRLGLQTDFFVRDGREMAAIVSANPFREQAERDPGHLVVLFLKDVPKPDDVRALEVAIPGREIVRASGRHLYVVYTDGIGRSRLTNVLIEKKLRTRSTGRNWNTVLKLAALTGV